MLILWGNCRTREARLAGILCFSRFSDMDFQVSSFTAEESLPTGTRVIMEAVVFILREEALLSSLTGIVE